MLHDRKYQSEARARIARAPAPRQNIIALVFITLALGLLMVGMVACGIFFYPY